MVVKKPYENIISASAVAYASVDIAASVFIQYSYDVSENILD